MSDPIFPLEIQELRGSGRSYTVQVRWHTSIKNIKDQLRNIIKGCPVSKMQIFHASSTKAVSNQMTLHDLGIDQEGPHVLRLALIFSSSPQYTLVQSKDIKLDDECDYMLEQVRLGLHCGHKPTKTDMLDCTGGVYFMKSGSNVPFAVFKPNDEEQGMPNNPKGHAGNGDVGLRPNFLPGEGYIRETASYILDKGNFCNVPPTTIVHCEHDTFHYPRTLKGDKPTFPKLGSLQKFIRASETFEDISPSKVGVLELQKIALLDMRLLNCDRNASNILVVRKPPSSFYQRNGSFTMKGQGPGSNITTAATAVGSGAVTGVERSRTSSDELATNSTAGDMEFHEFFFEDAIGSRYAPTSSAFGEMYDLVPIDHGYCIPTKLHIDEIDWAWFYCSQISAEVAPEIKEYMNALDIDQLLSELTAQIPLPDDSVYLLRMAHQLLVEGINAGLTLRDIAALIARIDEDVPSALEVALATSDDNALRAIEMRSERRTPHSRRGSPSFNKSFNSPNRAASRASAIVELQSDSLCDEMAAKNIAAPVVLLARSSQDAQDLSSSLVDGEQISPLRSLAVGQKMIHTTESISRPAAVHADMPSASARNVKRVVNSVLDFASMNQSFAGGSASATNKGQRSTPLKKEDKQEIAYLSSENIDKLQRSPDLLRFPMNFVPAGKVGAFQQPQHRQVIKEATSTVVCQQVQDNAHVKETVAPISVRPIEDQEDDYFCGEISEMKLNTSVDSENNCNSPSKLPGYGSYLLSQQRHPGVSLGLATARTHARPGEPLAALKSLDPAYLTPAASKNTFSFLGISQQQQRSSQTVPSVSLSATNSAVAAEVSGSRKLGVDFEDTTNRQQPRKFLDSPSNDKSEVHPLSVLGGSTFTTEMMKISSPHCQGSNSIETVVGEQSSPMQRGCGQLPCDFPVTMARHEDCNGSGRSSGMTTQDGGEFTASEASLSVSAGSPRSFGETGFFINAIMASKNACGSSNTMWSQPLQPSREVSGEHDSSLHSLSPSPPDSAEVSPVKKSVLSNNFATKATLVPSSRSEEVEDANTDTELEKLSRPSPPRSKRKKISPTAGIFQLQGGGNKRGKVAAGNNIDEEEMLDLASIPLNFLPRVTSFGAFESPPLYDLMSSERQVVKLRKERRRALAATDEFQQLRMVFAREAISQIVNKGIRSKLKSGGRSETI